MVDFMIEEEWLSIAGFPDYEVSNAGRVRSLSREVRCKGRKKDGTPATRRIGTTILQQHLRDGYPTVKLQREARGHLRHVHQLVCRAFHGDTPFPGARVLHRDDVRDHNEQSNLRWGTQKENAADSKANGRQPMGERSHYALLNEEQVREIRIRARVGEYAALGREFGVNKTTIRRIATRKSWGHL